MYEKYTQCEVYFNFEENDVRTLLQLFTRKWDLASRNGPCRLSAPAKMPSEMPDAGWNEEWVKCKMKMKNEEDENGNSWAEVEQSMQ